jgi:hypothetical protein
MKINLTDRRVNSTADIFSDSGAAVNPKVHGDEICPKGNIIFFRCATE